MDYAFDATFVILNQHCKPNNIYLYEKLNKINKAKWELSAGVADTKI